MNMIANNAPKRCCPVNSFVKECQPDFSAKTLQRHGKLNLTWIRIVTVAVVIAGVFLLCCDTQCSAQDQKPGDGSKPRSADERNIVGRWKVTGIQTRDRIHREQTLADIYYEFTPKKLTMFGYGAVQTRTYSLDASTNPKQIAITNGGKTKLGIYYLDATSPGSDGSLTICLRQNGIGRPTKVDSRDGGDNMILELSRGRDADRARLHQVIPRLLCRAASMSIKDFDKLSKSTTPLGMDSFTNQPLTLVLLKSEQNKVAKQDFRTLPKSVTQADLFDQMTISRKAGYVSVIQSKYITQLGAGDNATEAGGSVHFTAPGVYTGRVDFKSVKMNGKWKIVEFTLRKSRITLVVDSNGNWQRGKKSDRKRSRFAESKNAGELTPPEQKKVSGTKGCVEN